MARLLVRLDGGGEKLSRHGSLGQVVHPLETPSLCAHDVADVEQPFDGDLGLGPVPPGSSALGAAKAVCRQGPV
jgi:hypothetical protein